MLIMGVNRNSQLMVKEIHRQFKEIPGLKEGTGKPDYARCIDISTLGAIRELVPAGLTAIAATLLVGFIGGVQAIGGYLTGNIISGLLLALLMSNAGGLWDNAKKYIESGHFGGKGSDAHKAAVIGDTVGDPFKDTARAVHQHTDHRRFAGQFSGGGFVPHLFHLLKQAQKRPRLLPGPLFTEQQLTGRLPERCFSHRPCSLPQRNPFSPGWRWNTGSPRPCWPARPHNPHTACRSPGSSSADCPDT